MGDPQKNRVYKWEDTHICSHDKRLIPFDQLQTIVDYVWAQENLEYPPQVEPMPKNDRKAQAKANRLSIWAREEGMPTWVLLHEMSHSLTSTMDGMSNRHGKKFVGMYMKLLTKYVGIAPHLLYYTAKISRVEFDVNATPVFLEL